MSNSKFFIENNSSTKTKYKILNEFKEPLTSIPSKGFKDAWNSFFGWLSNFSIEYEFSLPTSDKATSTITIKNNSSILSQSFNVYENTNLKAYIKKNGYNSSKDFTITVNDEDMTYESNNKDIYFNIYDKEHKIVAVRRSPSKFDLYKVVIADGYDESLYLGIVIAIINGYKK